MVTPKFGKTAYEQRLEQDIDDLKRQIANLKAGGVKRKKRTSFFGEVKDAGAAGGGFFKRAYQGYKKSRDPKVRYEKTLAQQKAAERRLEFLGLQADSERKGQAAAGKVVTAKARLRGLQDRPYRGKGRMERFRQAARRTIFRR